MKKKLSAGAMGLLAIYPHTASANVFDTYGQSAATIAIGNASTADGDRAFAAYTNPALLPASKETALSVQSLYSQFALKELPATPGSQLPPDNSDQPDENQGMAFGLNLAVADIVHVGIASYLPQGSFGRVKGVSSYQPTYLRYSEQQEKPAIYTAVGVRLPAGFGIGVGAYYTLKAKGVLQINLSDTESEGRVDIVMEPVIAPYGGLSWQGSRLRLGLVYREAQETQSKIESAFAFSTDDLLLPFEANTSLVPFYDPALLRIGGSWTFDFAQLLFSVEEAQWSRYKAPLVALSGKDVASISAEGQSRDAGLQNTYAYRFGVIVPLPLKTDVDIRAGLESHSSANKSGSTSAVVDPSRQVFAFGGSWRMKKTADGKRLGLEAAYQYSRLGSVKTTTPKGSAIDLDSGASIQTFVGGLTYDL